MARTSLVFHILAATHSRRATETTTRQNATTKSVKDKNSKVKEKFQKLEKITKNVRGA